MVKEMRIHVYHVIRALATPWSELVSARRESVFVSAHLFVGVAWAHRRLCRQRFGRCHLSVGSGPAAGARANVLVALIETDVISKVTVERGADGVLTLRTSDHTVRERVDALAIEIDLDFDA
jgi:hypothetical protein